LSLAICSCSGGYGKDAFYPINDDPNNRKYQQYKQLGESDPNLIFGGRLGEYKYYDMHQVIAAALKLSKEIIKQNTLQPFQ
jgi:UDP-galactopyranose mutase